MWSFIERWRGKSKEARSRLAVAVAGSVTGIIAIVWLAALPARFTDTASQAASAIDALEGETQSPQAAGALQDLLTTAEALRGKGLGQESATTSRADEPALAIPRRVLIATTTASTTGERAP